MAEALRLADQRMYAQKQGGRVSAGEQSSNVLLRALAEGDPTARPARRGRRRARRGARRGARPARARGRAGAARGGAARHRQDRDPGRDPREARPALTPTSGGSSAATREIGERILPRRAGARARRERDPLDATSTSTARATRTGSPATEIPLVARIVFVCDAFDAMISPRPYRLALSIGGRDRRAASAAPARSSTRSSSRRSPSCSPAAARRASRSPADQARRRARNSASHASARSANQNGVNRP